MTLRDILLAVFLCALSGLARSAETDRKLAEQAFAVLDTYCYRCHGVENKAPGLNVLDHASLIAPRSNAKPAYVVAGKPEASRLWQRVGIDEDMPPLGVKPEKRPTKKDRKVLEDWIRAGAPPLVDTEQPRRFLTQDEMLTAVRRHLAEVVDPAHRSFQRYFTLTHLHNNPTVKNCDLRLVRAGLSKLLNSLSWQNSITELKAIDKDETILNVDLRRLGWDDRQWRKLLQVYPYGLSYLEDGNARRRDTAVDIKKYTGTTLPFVRADWLVATASRGDGAELYHTLLALPERARELEAKLDVKVEQDFLQGNLRRAGFAASNVSSQNRLVDRHRASHGAYWKSYDFKSNLDQGNLFLFPLGPAFPDNRYSDQAFQHAGGEIIFNLPNGLQGYLLVDDKGNRISTAPVEIVSDDQKTAGTPAIVNGLSCMACHKSGMIRFTDTVRSALSVDGAARRKVADLFPSKKDMDDLLSQDEERFLKALEKAVGPYLRAGTHKDREISDFPEPIAAVVRMYTRTLGVQEVAAELGLEDAGKLAARIREEQRLRSDLALGTLGQGGTIHREAWGSRKNGPSLFHKAARELERGTPHLP